MNLFVAGEVVPETEGPAADGARMLLLAGVDQHVAIELLLLFEPWGLHNLSIIFLKMS